MRRIVMAASSYDARIVYYNDIDLYITSPATSDNI